MDDQAVKCRVKYIGYKSVYFHAEYLFYMGYMGHLLGGVVPLYYLFCHRAVLFIMLSSD